MSKKIFVLYIIFLVNLIISRYLTGMDLKGNDVSEAEIDTYIQPYLDAGCFSGVILIARNGKILVNKGYGLSSRESGLPVSTHTKFQIASVSKLFTAMAIMMLWERNRLHLNDPLDRYIPDYPQGDKITIHHLLIHTSGIPDVNSLPEYSRKSGFPLTLAEIIQMFKGKPLNFSPGERYSYSNSNYNLLALIIEKISGLDYGEFLFRNIFKPLDMTDTGHRRDMSRIIKNMATGYTPHGPAGIRKAPFVNWSTKTGNGSLYSTAIDLYKLDRTLYTEKILKKSSLVQMFKGHINGVGYGCFVGQRLNRRVVRSNGRSPGFTACFDRYVDEDACIIILSNNYSPVPHVAIKDLAAILFGESYIPPEPITAKQIKAESLDRYTGRYLFDAHFYRPNAVVWVVRKKQYLVLKWSDTYFSSLRTLGETLFLDRLFWAYVIFQMDFSGKVTGFIWRDTSDYQAKKINDQKGKK